jgi:hypothetical protein
MLEPMSKKRGQQHKKSNARARRDAREKQQKRQPAANTVKVVARSWETLALDVPLRFPVPATAAGIDGAADYWWRLIEYGTEVSDPTAFPPLEQRPEDEALRACRRYIETADDLAASSALNHPVTLEVKMDQLGGEQEVLFNPPAPDASAGFAALLRHFYSSNEKASFLTVMKLLRTQVAGENGPEQAEQLNHLDAWKRAEGLTRQRSVQNQAIKRLIADGRAPRDPGLDTYPDVAPPEQIISDYFYGDHLHWDSKASVVDERGENPFLDAWYRHGFFTAAAGLAHIYVGFAALVQRAISKHSA